MGRLRRMLSERRGTIFGPRWAVTHLHEPVKNIFLSWCDKDAHDVGRKELSETTAIQVDEY